MSEESLPELMCKFRRQSPGTTKHHLLAELVNARIRRAETAERLAEAFEAAYVADGHACDDGAMDAAWNQYTAAREAVRKLEDEQ